MKAYKGSLAAACLVLLDAFSPRSAVSVESRDAAEDTFSVNQACEEFNDESALGSGWFFSDCAEIWTSWAQSLSAYIRTPYPDRQIFQNVSAEQRRRGFPCQVESGVYNDGVGSTGCLLDNAWEGGVLTFSCDQRTEGIDYKGNVLCDPGSLKLMDGKNERRTRNFATWVYAEEMGCDWVPRKLSEKEQRVSVPDGGGAYLYCHTTSNATFPQNVVRGDVPEDAATRCTVNNWNGFFGFDNHWATLYEGDRRESISTPGLWYFGDNLRDSVNRFFGEGGFGKPPWDHWVFDMSMSAGTYFVNTASWDQVKREATRKVLSEFRSGFHQFPRPWYKRRPTCAYSSSTIDVAIHVRLGDRAAVNGDLEVYFDFLDGFMDTVTSAALARGSENPVFHIFSETSVPCPSSDDGRFNEFKRWPVELDQIPPCEAAKPPEECIEKTVGAPSCRTERSGIFRVQDKPLYLHNGDNVENDLACMIEADAILMGCSTFGHIAGMLNSGIKFFSLACSGYTTFWYQMMPALAVVDQGHMWVPVSGSWRDPVIFSEPILHQALDHLLEVTRKF